VTSYALWCAATGDDARHVPRAWRREDVANPRRNTVHSAEDARVLAQLRAGDARAFDYLVVEYWDVLCTFAAGYVKDEELAKELVADVFAGLWERHTHVKVQTSVEAYLFGAVRNRARTAHRDRVRRTGLLRDAAASGDVPAMAGPQRALDAELERDERMVRLQAAVDGLPVRLREATVLRWEREMAYEEIAEALAISPAAARQLVSRALRLLRQVLAG
jgi:RNA polymerase sigma-70 factor (ECF subfamily)